MVIVEPTSILAVADRGPSLTRSSAVSSVIVKATTVSMRYEPLFESVPVTVNTIPATIPSAVKSPVEATIVSSLPPPSMNSNVRPPAAVTEMPVAEEVIAMVDSRGSHSNLPRTRALMFGIPVG